MANPNSDSASNNAAIDNFFKYFVAASEANLLGLFTADAPGPPQIPSVGIANHGANFIGSADVKALFDRLFSSFPDLTLKEVDKTRRLYSLDSYTGYQTVGAQATLKGTFQKMWFPKVPGTADSASHYSKPLSDIAPNQGNYLVTTIAVFAMFALSGNSIAQISFYLDRYKFKADLEPTADTSANQVFEKHTYHRP